MGRVTPAQVVGFIRAPEAVLTLVREVAPTLVPGEALTQVPEVGRTPARAEVPILAQVEVRTLVPEAGPIPVRVEEPILVLVDRVTRVLAVGLTTSGTAPRQIADNDHSTHRS